LILVLSLLVNAALATVTKFFQEYLEGWDIVWQAADFVLSFVMLIVVFGLIFKVLPEVNVTWSDIWPAAVLTTVLFSIVRQLLGVYLSSGAFSSIYGAASSLFVVLFWFYFSSQILLLGAECTHVYATRHGSLANSE
jgi:membrane protein